MSYNAAKEIRLRTSPWVVTAGTLILLLMVDQAHWILTRLAAYNALHQHHPFYIAESIDKLGGVILCATAVWVLRRGNPREIARELGFAAPVLPAIAFALVCSAPMLVGFAITRRLSPNDSVVPLLFLTIFSPIVEEIEYRGFGVRQLQRGTGWPFWLVVWPSALLSGWGHIEQGQSWQEMAGLFFLTGAGAVTFAWLLHRWRNLWIPIMLHIAMNLWWEMFSVARTAVGGWFPFMMQNLTIVLAIIITLVRTRARPPTLVVDA